MPKEINRYWDGKTVHMTNFPDRTHDRRSAELAMTSETAGELANLLRQVNGLRPLSPALNEVLNALDYVLVGDPASVAAHRRMESGKGMTPDGGHKEPKRRRSTGSDPMPYRDPQI